MEKSELFSKFKQATKNWHSLQEKFFAESCEQKRAELKKSADQVWIEIGQLYQAIFLFDLTQEYIDYIEGETA